MALGAGVCVCRSTAQRPFSPLRVCATRGLSLDPARYAGKHVLCEKPFAASPEEVATMYAAADEAGVMLQEGMWTRFFPATEHARTAIAEGAVGQVKTLQSTFPDRCYPIQAAPMVFGTDTYPVVAAAGSGEHRCTWLVPFVV